ncbi:MAG: isoprenylcysteine carboxylmethyltransferase family protein [Nitrospinae bacterium]|nr:isoprenylcysteine carboxylmethyltransferase family protein [Nitrospinota bacterium]
MAAILLLQINFGLFAAIFLLCLFRNFNFNIILVGITYLLPLIPWWLGSAQAERMLIVSCSNLIFGIIEVVFFTLTERPEDIKFNRAYLQQLFGHVLPIVAALIGMSFVSRSTLIPVGAIELSLIVILFTLGSILRILAISQLGILRFKFNIAFREQQTLKTDQLHGYMRHPTYTAMMLVVFAYAVTTHSWYAGIIGCLSAWFGFQYRIYFEEKALKEQFGEAYDTYRGNTPMWLPFLNWK